MAIQNDNTILDKGDLKAYHEAIAPMLGGTFMVRTNNSDYYSTDEKVVGVWTDGRPIYQKVFPFNSVVLLQDSTWYQTGLSGTGFENIVGAFGYRTQETGGSGPGHVPLFAICQSSTREIYIMETRANSDVELSGFVLQYTKTTDTAGSATTTPGAYDINFPNTWPENTEVFFGNGVYGYRATGVHNIVEDDRTDTLITTLPVDPSGKFVSFGGSVAWKASPSDANTYENAFPFDSPTQAGKPVSAQLLKVVSGGVYLRTWGNTTASGLPYDIWFTFTK